MENLININLIEELYKSELCDRLDSRSNSKAEDESMEELAKAVKEKKNVADICDLAAAYGCDREYSGFRFGFQLAFKLCAEGLMGGVRA